MALLLEAFGPLAVVSLVAWLTQRFAGVRIEGKAWAKLTTAREPGRVRFRAPDASFLDPTQTRDLSRSSSGRPVVHWQDDRKHWEDRAAAIRTNFLQRTQETAERWRNIFAGLLGVFGVVFFVNKPDLGDTSDPPLVRLAILTVIALALHAVAYTGWAAAGLPKMQMDVDDLTALEAEMRQGARSLVRLRVGITAGCLTAAGLTLTVAAVLR